MSVFCCVILILQSPTLIMEMEITDTLMQVRSHTTTVTPTVCSNYLSTSVNEQTVDT